MIDILKTRNEISKVFQILILGVKINTVLKYSISRKK